MNAPRLPRRWAFLLAALVAALAVSSLTAAPASAGVNDIPTARVNVRSIAIDGYTGNIVVRARVKCTRQVKGIGTASWSVKAVQDLRAQATAQIPCNGDRQRSVLQLDPKRGRFHPGQVNMTITVTRVGSTSAEVDSRSFATVV
jgi:hypothetical protein